MLEAIVELLLKFGILVIPRPISLVVVALIPLPKLLPVLAIGYSLIVVVAINFSPSLVLFVGFCALHFPESHKATIEAIF